MTTPRFYYGQGDYITQLNYLDTTFAAAVQAGTDAGTQAAAAAASATAGANSATASANSATASANSATNSGNSATSASGSATSAAGSASSASTASTAAQGYMNTSASNLTQTLAARDAAITASQVAANPTEMLAAFAQIIHSGNVVTSCIGDVAKDSDPNWIKRMLHTSWYSETICTGVWRGQQTNLTAAWNITGAAVGDFYQSTTDGKFYTIGGTKASPAQTEVFRGNKREFPSLFAAVVEATRLIIYDLTAPGCPMWMVFTTGGTWPTLPALGRAVTTKSCVAYANGDLLVGSNVASSECLIRISFTSEYIRSHSDVADSYVWPGNIAARNSLLTVKAPDSSVPAIVSASVNAVAVTVLPDAPVDPATGLQVPTIVVATPGGVSVVKHDGTVVNSSNGNPATNLAVNSDKSGFYWDINAGSNVFYQSFPVSATFPSDFNIFHTGVPGFTFATSHRIATLAGRSQLALGNSNGLYQWRLNPSAPAKSMLAQATIAYNTGWQVGDTRLCVLADTVVETATGSGELVSNGTFTTDNSGWTVNSAGGTSSVSGGVVTLTNPSVAGGNQAQTTPITTVVGRTYVVSADCIGASTFIGAGTAAATPTNLGAAFLTATGKAIFQFTATGTTTYIGIGINTTTASQVATFDNVSTKLGTPDRSVKGKGLTVIGSLTKSAVATGSQMIGFSGYSTSNYQEQAYNSDLDYGAGDFWVRGWIKFTTLPVNANVFSRATGASSAALGVYFNASSNWCFVCSATNVGVATTAVAAAGAWTCFDLVRASGTLTLYINGVSVYSAANTENTTNTSALLRVGLNYLLASPLPSDAQLALLRFGNTAPSVNQLTQIYRDELAMFRPGALVTLDGTSSSVVGIGYEELSDVIHAETSGWGRTGMHGLVRTDSAATAVGAPAGVAAGSGVHITFGATGARFTQPSLLLRDELRRGYQEKKAMAKEVFPLDLDFSAGQTTATLPLGFTAKAVQAAGSLKRLGATKDYTVTFDGYQDSIVFGTSPGAVWVHVDMNRRTV